MRVVILRLALRLLRTCKLFGRILRAGQFFGRFFGFLGRLHQPRNNYTVRYLRAGGALHLSVWNASVGYIIGLDLGSS